MASNEKVKLTRKMGTDLQKESRMTAEAGGWVRGGGIERKGKKIHGLENSVRIAGIGAIIRGLNSNG